MMIFGFSKERPLQLALAVFVAVWNISATVILLARLEEIGVRAVLLASTVAVFCVVSLIYFRRRSNKMEAVFFLTRTNEKTRREVAAVSDLLVAFSTVLISLVSVALVFAAA